jgi:hypothetical protein
MNLAIILCDEYAVVVFALLGTYHSVRFSILAIDLIFATSKGIIVLGEPDTNTIQTAMPSHLGICMDFDRLDEPVRISTFYDDDLFIVLRACRVLLRGRHVQPFLLVVDVRLDVG